MSTATNYRLKTFFSTLLSFILIGAISASSNTTTLTDSCTAEISVTYDSLSQSAILTVNHSGTPNSSVFWSDSSMAETITVFESGEYCVEVYTETQCFAMACVMVDLGSTPDCHTYIVKEPLPEGGYQLIAETSEPGTTSSFYWGDGSTTSSIIVQETGEYCVNAVDAVGCQSEACIFIDIPPSCTAHMYSYPDTTNGGAYVGVDPSGVAPFIYQWNNGETTAGIDVESSAEYCVTMTDANGCVAVGCKYVDAGQSNTTCTAIVYAYPDTINGGAYVGVDPSGDGPFVYQWNNGEITAGIDVESSAEYCVTVTDVNGCVAVGCKFVEASNGNGGADNESPTFTVPADLTLYSDIQCFADVQISITGDVVDENDNQSNNLNATYTDNITDYCLGSFNIQRIWTLVDDAGNASTDIQNITVYDTIAPQIQTPADFTLLMDANCWADTSVAATGYATVYDNCDANASISYFDQIVSGTGGGNCGGDMEILRTWTAVDDCGNQSDKIQIIILEVSADDHVDSCFTYITTVDQGDGVFKLIAETTASGSHTIIWHDSLYQDGDYLYVEESGNYCVTVIDENQCYSDACLYVEVPTTGPDTCFIDPILHFYDDPTTGTSGLSIDPEGAYPFSVTWSDGSVDELLIPSESGTYCVTVVDADGCIGQDCKYFEVAVEPVDSCAVWIELIPQDDGSVKAWAHASGGEDFTYQWHPSTTDPGTNQEPYQYITESGSYCAIVFNDNGCQVEACIDVEIPEVEEPVDSCTVWLEQIPQTEGRVKILANATGAGPYTYSWSTDPTGAGGESYIYVSETGDYCVVVYDANQCASEACIFVEVPVEEVVDSCAVWIELIPHDDGSVKAWAHATGGDGFGYQWNATGTTNTTSVEQYLYVTESGNYCVQVFNTVGCQTEACIYVEVSVEEPSDSCFTYITSVDQGDGQFKLIAEISGNGPSTIIWHDSLYQDGDYLYVEESGNYCVTVIDANQCSSDACLYVDVPTQEPADSCAVWIELIPQDDGRVKAWAHATGGDDFIYQWHPTTTTAGATQEPYKYITESGSYCVIVYNDNGCQVETCIDVEIPEENEPVDTCAVALTTEVFASDYVAEVRAESSGTAPFEYMWSNGTSGNAIEVYQTQDVCVTVTDAIGCVVVKCIEVEVPEEVEICDISVERIDSDSSNVIVLNAYSTGVAATYVWNTGATGPYFTVTESGEYCVTATSPTGCTAEKCVYVEVDDFICETTLVQSTGSSPYEAFIEAMTTGVGPFTYLWENGTTDSHMVATESGRFCVIVTDARGCSSEACLQVEVAVPTCDSYIYVEQKTDDQVTLGVETSGQGPFEYFWSTGQQSEIIIVNESKEYCVEVIDALGCLSWHCEYVEVENYNNCTVEIEVIENADSSEFKVIANPSGVAPFTYQWAHGDTARYFYPELDGKFCVTVTDAEGCVSTTCLETEGITPGVELEAYPSPAHGDFHVVIDSDLEFEGKVEIRDISGNLLFTKYIDISEGIQSLDFNSDEYPVGMFFVNIIRGSHVETIRIVKATGN